MLGFYYALNFYGNDVAEWFEDNVNKYLEIFDIQDREDDIWDIVRGTVSIYSIKDLCENLMISACYQAISDVVFDKYGIFLEYYTNGCLDCDIYAKDDNCDYVSFIDHKEFLEYYFEKVIKNEEICDKIQQMENVMSIDNIYDIVLEVVDTQADYDDIINTQEKVLDALDEEYEYWDIN